MALPPSWLQFKVAFADLQTLLDVAPCVDESERQKRLLVALSTLDLACLALPEVALDHFDHMEWVRVDFRPVVVQAFPEFGYYNFVPPDFSTVVVEPVIKDAVDDLDEIIADVSHALEHEIQFGWERAAWEARESYEAHCGSHLVDLRSYVYRLRFIGP